MDFFLIGAPKTGTTAIAKFLSENESIDFSSYKEPNFFSQDIVGEDRFVKTLDDYKRLYQNNGKLRGEGSTTYIYSDNAVDQILSINPNAKFIVGVRESISHLQSQFNQMLKTGMETKTNFQEAWDLQGERARGNKIPPGCSIPFNLQYKRIISLGFYIERLLKKVDKNNVFIFRYEELNLDFQSVYEEILTFLEIEAKQQIIVERVNVAKAPKNQKLMEVLQRLTLFRKKLGLSNFGGAGRWLRDKNLTTENVQKIPDPIKEQVRLELKSDKILLERFL